MQEQAQAQEQGNGTDRPRTIDEHPSLKQEHSPQSEAVRRFISPWLGGADTLVYVLVGLVFLLGAIAMLGYSVFTFLQHFNEGFPRAIVTLVNDLLLVMIIMEVLRTVLSYIEERGASLRPFLFIGAISATRRILAIGAEASITDGKAVLPDDFKRRLIDLGVNAGVILAIAIALFLLSQRDAK
ncbi:MAG: phosphate-starvation-inducible PsiE family protein [Thermomicrobiales bacterium]